MIHRRLVSLLLIAASQALAHSEGEGVASRVGADKGVVNVDKENGFLLRPQVEGNFSIQKIALKAGPSWTIPASSLVYSGLETQVLRQRKGFWKSVDVELLRKSGGTALIRSKDLTAGDQLATHGVGFLKIIEQSVLAPQADEHDEKNDTNDHGDDHDHAP